MSFLVEIADEEYKNKNKFIEIIKTVIEFLKIKKFKNNNVREKSIVSKVEKFNIEFSDIYELY